MRELRRWSYAKHGYEPYMIPDGWKVSLYENDDVVTEHCYRDNISYCRRWNRRAGEQE